MQQEQPKHTPTPWKNDDGQIFTENKHGYNSQYTSIARVYDMYSDDGQAQPNASFILKAVNMHDELIKTLNTLKSLVETTRMNDEFKKSVSNENKNMMSAALLSANKLLNQSNTNP